MSKTRYFENAFLRLMFLNEDISGIGDAVGIRGSFAAGNLYFSLHSSDPNSGDQSTYELNYPSYQRVLAERGENAFSVADNVLSLVEEVAFPICSGPSEQRAIYLGIGTKLSGAGILLWSDRINPEIVCRETYQPIITTKSKITED